MNELNKLLGELENDQKNNLKLFEQKRKFCVSQIKDTINKQTIVANDAIQKIMNIDKTNKNFKTSGVKKINNLNKPVMQVPIIGKLSAMTNNRIISIRCNQPSKFIYPYKFLQMTKIGDELFEYKLDLSSVPTEHIRTDSDGKELIDLYVCERVNKLYTFKVINGEYLLVRSKTIL